MDNFSINNQEDFEFIDFPSTRGNGATNNSYDMCYIRVTRYPVARQRNKLVTRVSLSMKVTNILKTKGLNGFRVRKDNVTGDLMIIFCENTEKRYGTVVKAGGSNTKTAVIQNRPFIDFLADNLGLNGIELHSHIIQLSEDLSNSDKYATFKILKQ